MSKMINEVGNKYNLLTVLERDQNKTNSSKTVYWKCKCECGNIVSVPGTKLRNGTAKSCGCLRKQKLSQIAKQKQFINEIGHKYGRLTVIEIDHIDKKQGAFWKCLCECGNECIVRGTQLRSGKTQSCGCLSSKGEEVISRLLTLYNITFEMQKTFENCRFPETNALAKFDFYLPNNNIIIEYDGSQHYIDYNNKVFTHEKFIKTQEYDKIKTQFCINNNIRLIRIRYDEDIETRLLNENIIEI